MRKVYKPSTPAEMYDRALHYARDKRLPAEYPKPQPTAEWPEENITLLEQYCEWLRAGGASPAVIRNIYLPMAGHVLGLALKPHPQLDLEVDLQRGLDFLKAKQMSAEWTDICRCSMLKFRRFLCHQRGQIESKVIPYEPKRDTEGIPNWLVNELERFQHVQQRNWRETRLEPQIRRFWIAHLHVWRFLCERCGVKVYPHRLRHTAATQLLNAGCRVTSIQKFLGHKELSTTMVYARVHDQTVADDYYAAMQQVEQQLDLLGTKEEANPPIGQSERVQLLELASHLEQPELNFDARLTIVAQMRAVLSYPKIDKTVYSLPPSISMEESFA
jgi:hypothetical protein